VYPIRKVPTASVEDGDSAAGEGGISDVGQHASDGDQSTCVGGFDHFCTGRDGFGGVTSKRFWV